VDQIDFIAVHSKFLHFLLRRLFLRFGCHDTVEFGILREMIHER